jgi:deoxyinosine 3'endonuclease (endonuclease V)
MILAFDTYYTNSQAQTVAVAFAYWNAEEPLFVKSEIHYNIEDYEPGAFFKRELPCIMSLWNRLDTSAVTEIVIDGYVYVDDKFAFGLGAHLFNALHERIPVIGVAKSKFGPVDALAREVYRGGSFRPLYVSSIGVDLEIALDNIRKMHGDYRIPTLLKLTDTQSRLGFEPS